MKHLFLKLQAQRFREQAGEGGDPGAGAAGGAGADEAAKKAAEEAAAKKAADEAAGKAGGDGGKKPSDEEAKLLKEVMQKKEALQKTQADLAAAQERLKKFDGIDPEAVRAMLAERAQAEEKALEAKGDYERLKQRMAEAHASETASLKEQIAQLQNVLSQREGAINELSIGSLFGQSQFINSELVLTPAKARVVYGDHFELVDGKVVGYDKPKGASGRTAIVDSMGNPVNFDEALRKIVEADPEKDALLKSKIKPGANSESGKVGKQANSQKDAPTDGVSKIAAGLKGLKVIG
ncbi:hypothetical protein N5B55_05115 [Ralstonia pickettii]|uniref:DUF6651 domain-containing protein n=1 Tax=Ralstonia pickettii TaxID=329 RepID=UPI0027152131|nr:DUF6651 domain-containing protein [Ralstonia pickettii]WKZ86335.1 hypothetical protein N5B55_05115 [Ralstonia pickettii]